MTSKSSHDRCGIEDSTRYAHPFVFGSFREINILPILEIKPVDRRERGAISKSDRRRRAETSTGQEARRACLDAPQRAGDNFSHQGCRALGVEAPDSVGPTLGLGGRFDPIDIKGDLSGIVLAENAAFSVIGSPESEQGVRRDRSPKHWTALMIDMGTQRAHTIRGNHPTQTLGPQPGGQAIAVDLGRCGAILRIRKSELTKRRTTRTFIWNFQLRHFDVSHLRNKLGGETCPALSFQRHQEKSLSIVTRIQNRQRSAVPDP